VELEFISSKPHTCTLFSSSAFLHTGSERGWLHGTALACTPAEAMNAGTAAEGQ